VRAIAAAANARRSGSSDNPYYYAQHGALQSGNPSPHASDYHRGASASPPYGTSNDASGTPSLQQYAAQQQQQQQQQQQFAQQQQHAGQGYARGALPLPPLPEAGEDAAQLFSQWAAEGEDEVEWGAIGV
jgi:hypothetical protein